MAYISACMACLQHNSIMASSTDLGSPTADRQKPLYSKSCTSSVVSRRSIMVLYLLDASSESVDAPDGGVAH
jgi:hypothetical protein